MRRGVLVLIGFLILISLVTVAIGGVFSSGEWVTQTIKSGLWEPFTSSGIALTSSDQPRIAYFDSNDSSVVLASWNSSWSYDTAHSVATNGNGTLYMDIEIDSSGNSHIAYKTYGDSLQNYLQYTYDTGSWGYAAYSVKTETPIATLRDQSFIIDDSGYPHYAVNIGYPYHVAHITWDGSSWTKQFVDFNDSSSSGISIGITSTDRICISYGDVYNIKYAIWNGTGWDTQMVDTFVYSVGMSPCLALTSADTPHIVYDDNLGLYHAEWNGSSWDKEVVLRFRSDSSYAYSAGEVFQLTSEGSPWIAYNYKPDSVSATIYEYAAWNGSSWETASLSYYGDFVLNSANNPNIVDYVSDSGYLVYTRYANTIFAPDDDNCFVATAAYGDAECAEVVALRGFRDSVLLQSRLGRMFAGLYYNYGPRAAEYVSSTGVTGWIVRTLLAPVVWLLG